MIDALSPLDGRYEDKTKSLRAYFSETALMSARVFVEIEYFITLSDEPKVRELPKLSSSQRTALRSIAEKFTTSSALQIKAIEKKTNHDVKAVEYYLKEKIKRIPKLKEKSEFLHFGLTSEDVNNLAYGILIQKALKEVIVPELRKLIITLKPPAKWQKIALLSLTHGQPATPTTLGKEMLVFTDRLERQCIQLKEFRMQGKFGGAVGTYAAHRAAYAEVNWEAFGRKFLRSLGLEPLAHSTQINPHDDIAELSHIMIRINTILIDYSRDIWSYISRGIFTQQIIKGEVGSSTMPHKVNPIDFENAEGNLGLSTALFHHFALKLPVSRLQRDLTDSTVQRSIGSAFGYHLIAIISLLKGISKLHVNMVQLKKEIEEHPEVRSEAIQTVLRKHGVAGAYEKLKALTRGEKVTHRLLDDFVDSLPISKEEKRMLKK